MAVYYEQEDRILQWLDNHPGEKWIDLDFQCGYRQFFQDQSILPEWAPQLKNIEWKRPEEIIKDPKFMIIE